MNFNVDIMKLVAGHFYTINDSHNSRAHYKVLIGKPVLFQQDLGSALARVSDTDGRIWLVRPWDVFPLENGKNEDYVSLLKEE